MKNIALYLAAFSLMFIASSCDTEEFLTPENPVEAPWLTAVDFERSAIGAYYALSGNGGFRHVYTHRRLVNEVASDVATYLPDAAGNADIGSAYNRENTNLGFLNNSVFRSCYNAIGNANAGIGFIEENNGDPYPNDPNKAQVTRIWGELLFVRAFANWNLARTYLPAYRPGGDNSDRLLPNRIGVPGNLEEATRSEIISTEELYQSVRSDLELAKTLLPERYDPSLGHDLSYSDGRANKFAAAALLSRVYFQMGMTAEAQRELDFVIDQNGGDYDLSEDPIEAFNKDFAGRGQEVIWYYLQYDGDGIGSWKRPGRFESYSKCDRGCSNGGNDARNAGARTVVASDAALLEMGWINPDFTEPVEATYDKRYTQLTFRYEAAGSDTINGNPPEPRFNFNRAYVWNHKYYRAANGGRSNTAMLRLAEMHLTRALLRFNDGNLQGAADDLNVVRARAWDEVAAGAPYTPVTSAEITAAMIHTERMKEMLFEGDRLWYLQAQQIAIPNGDRGAGSVPFDDAGLYYAIPDNEIDLNTGFQGN